LGARLRCNSRRSSMEVITGMAGRSYALVGVGSSRPCRAELSLRCRLPGAGGSLEESRRFHPLRPALECRRRAAPTQLVPVAKERRVGAQRGELLEQQRKIAPISKQVRGEFFDRAVLVEELRCGDGADSGNPGVTVRRVADESEVVGNQLRRHSELLAHALGIANVLGLPIDLHDGISGPALR